MFFRSETHFIPAFYRVYGNPRSKSQALKLAKKMVKMEWIARWEEDIDTLREIFPAARFIHIVRDGRDVSLSLLKANFGPRTIYGAATYWQKCVQAGLRSENSVPANRLMNIR